MLLHFYYIVTLCIMFWLIIIEVNWLNWRHETLSIKTFCFHSLPSRLWKLAIKVDLSEIWTDDHWIPFRYSNRLSYQAMILTRTKIQLCTAATVSFICSVSDFISAFVFVSRHVYFNWNFVEVITWVFLVIYNYI